MNYNIENGALESIISLPICKRIINCDVSEEVNIPEGLPDARRALALKENILSPTKFIGAKALDMSGAVDYSLIYLGTDGCIYSAPFSAEYSFSVPFESTDAIDASESVSVIYSLSAENDSIRMSTPRRFQVRSGIRASVICFGRGALNEDISGADGDGDIQRLRLVGDNVFFDCESSDIVTLTDEYLLAEGDRIIYSDADVFISDVRADGEMVRASGEAVIKLVLENGGKIETVVRKLPFDAETDLEELDASDTPLLCRAFGSVNELDVSVDDGRARIEVGIALEICLAQNKSVEYTRDIYSTSKTCNAEYKKYALPCALLNKNVSITQSERTSASDADIPMGAEILDSFGRALCEEAALENRRYVLRGKVKYKIICRCDEDVICKEVSLPFKYEAELGDIDAAGLCADVRVMGARVRCDGENLLIESELAISASVYGLCELDMIAKASFGEPIEQNKNQIVVCFKSSDESAFELAKRYHVPYEQLSDKSQSESFVIIER